MIHPRHDHETSDARDHGGSSPSDGVIALIVFAVLAASVLTLALLGAAAH